MSMCQSHWTKLREAVAERGLSTLVSESGAEAALKTAAMLSEKPTIDNFDALMYAFLNLHGNAGQILEKVGANPLYILSDGPEDTVMGYGLLYDGKKWPRCAVCYLNLAHEVSCRDHGCKLDIKNGYEWTIGLAADSALHAWRQLQP